MDKRTLLTLRRSVDEAKQIFEKDRSVQTLRNYLFVRNAACEVVKAFDWAETVQKIFNESNSLLFEYKYILRCFKDILGIKKYSDILYGAQVDFQKYAADKQKEVKQNDP